jgi:hypothetical protein
MQQLKKPWLSRWYLLMIFPIMGFSPNVNSAVVVHGLCTHQAMHLALPSQQIYNSDRKVASIFLPT